MEDEVTTVELSASELSQSGMEEGCHREELVLESYHVSNGIKFHDEDPTSGPHSITCSPKSRLLRQLTTNWKRGLEIGILSGIILVVWVLFMIPTILYALPPLREVSNQVL